MRLLAVINNPVFGGAHNELLMQRDGLAEHGWESLALTTDEPAAADAAERLRDAGVETIQMPLHRLRATMDPRPNLALAARYRPEVHAIRRVLRGRDIDLVQVHGPTNPHGATAAHREGVAVCWEIYDTVAPPWLVRVTMPMVMRLADSITTWGRALAESHPPSLDFGDRLVVVTPPVDLDRFSPDTARRSAARAELGIDNDAIAIGAVGNRNPSKGHDHLIAATARLAADHPRVVVRILGGVSPAHAAYEEGLHAAIAEHGLGDRVRLLDPGTRVAELMPALDVFTLASVPRSEGMPTAILEAMGCELPVVATDVGAVRELVAHDDTGFVVPSLDDAALATALGRLAGDPELRRRMGAAGRARALAHFRLESVIEKRLRAYTAALEHRRARTAR